MKFIKILIFVVLFGAEFSSKQALACSSCGSGAADPVILNPMEKQKFYLGLAQQSHFRDVDSQGDVRRDLGPTQKTQLEVAFAQRLTRELFASLATGVGLNERQGRSEGGVLDTTLNARYTLLNQTLLEPWIPQVQLMLSHRFKTTRSVQDARKENYLDSFGAGYSETFAGVDVWFGMGSFLFGGSIMRSQPWEASTQYGSWKPGASQKEILTAGVMIGPEWKLIGGAIRDRREGMTLDGQDLPNSDRASHDLFLTVESLRADVNNFRVSVSKRASWGDNKNATQLLSTTFAWMRVL